MTATPYISPRTGGAAIRPAGIRLTYSLLGLLLIIDQLLLPMFKLGPVSFKVSYVILGFWFLHWLLRSGKGGDASRDINRIFAAVGIILFCIVLGEFWLAISFSVPSYYDAVRGMLTLVFAALAFGIGRSSIHFKMGWLVPMLFWAIALNFLFIILKNDLPTWLINFYYPERAVSDAVGFQSVEDIIALGRPRGLFGNPNASMLMVNLIVLFIHLSFRNNLLKLQSASVAAAIIILPVILAAILASRGEFIVAVTLGFLNYRLLARSHGRGLRRKLATAFILLVCLISLVAVRYGDDLGFTANIERISKIAEIVSKAETEEERKLSTIERPLFTLETFAGRFFYSPLIGTGISATKGKHFEAGTQYFHNDWFYILTVAGLIGTLSLVWILRLFVVRLGWPILIPFVLPGLVNTFMLNIPAFIAYFALSGVALAALSQKKNFETRVAVC